jgi:hypothetical protein
MTVLAEDDRTYWREVLTGGGSTTLPRWSLERGGSVAEHRTPVPADLRARLDRLAEDLGVPLSTVLLAAHAKVLAALTGESEVSTA